MRVKPMSRPSWVLSAAVAGLLAVSGCSDYVLNTPDPVPPAEPPEPDEDPYGEPPDWETCPRGFLGAYYNLPADHPDVGELEVGGYAEVDWEAADWWEPEYLAFTRFDATLEHGSNWWPVDEGLTEDPAYFAASWLGWIRARGNEDVRFALAASTDARVVVNDEVVAEIRGGSFELQTFTARISSGQAPIAIHYAHRGGDSAFRFRLVSGDVELCYPNYDEE